MTTEPNPPIVVMGVQGVGKSTIGSGVAAVLGLPFVDGDRLHPERNIRQMAAGVPLQDADRLPWLQAVGEVLAAHRGSGVVVACSALKRSYRDILRSYAPDLYIVEPWGPVELVARRVTARTHEYMPAELLQSQFDTLEPLGDDEHGIRVSIEPAPSEIVATVLADYRAQTSGHAGAAQGAAAAHRAEAEGSR